MYQEPFELPVGIPADGKQCRSAVLHNLTHRISQAAAKSPDIERATDQSEMGLIVFGYRLAIVGINDTALPLSKPITLDQMLDLDEADIEAILAADKRLQTRIKRFPGAAEGAATGAAEDGPAVAGRE